MSQRREEDAGVLWRELRAVEARALASGALVPIPSRGELIEDAGIAFQVRIAEALARKDASRSLAPQNRAGALAGRTSNPFLPPQAELLVRSLSDTHLCLLNKFPVIEHHLVIVTRAFEAQESLLTRADFEALWACFEALGGKGALGFYNAGATAGASQRHKHLQLVPLPFAAAPGAVGVPPGFPTEDLFRELRSSGEPGAAVRLPGLPFTHAAGRLPEPAGRKLVESARASLEMYRALREALAQSAERHDEPYNLLATRDWMCLVPRRRQGWESIEVNALGYAGSIFLRSPGDLARLETLGPMTLLRHVTRV